MDSKDNESNNVNEEKTPEIINKPEEKTLEIINKPEENNVEVSKNKVDSEENLDDHTQKNITNNNEINQNLEEKVVDSNVIEQKEPDNIKMDKNNLLEIDNIMPQDENGQIQITSLQEVLEKVNKLDITKENPISTVILKNKTSSLRNLLVYDSDSSGSDSSSDSESDSHNETVIGDQDEEDDDPQLITQNSNKTEAIILEQIPDLPEIEIDLSKEQFLHIGNITNFISNLVTIDAIPNTSSFNLDTVLFIDDNDSKKPFGVITDVIGPVCQPVYCVALRNEAEIKNFGLEKNMKVYTAPQSLYTKYVFVKDLMKMKGTDASWIGDEEPPSDEMESSDDEFNVEKEPSRKRHNIDNTKQNNSDKKRNRFRNPNNRWANRAAPNRGPSNVFLQGFNPNVPPPNLVPNMPNTYGMAPMAFSSSYPQNMVFYSNAGFMYPSNSDVSNNGSYPNPYQSNNFQQNK